MGGTSFTDPVAPRRDLVEQDESDTNSGRPHVVLCRWDRLILEAALATGTADITVVIDEWELANRHIDPQLVARLRALKVIRAFDDMSAMSELAVQLQSCVPSITRVISLAEQSQLGAAYLADVIGTAGPSIETSVLVRNKVAMKRRVTAAGVRCAAQVALESGSRQEVEAAGRRLGWPLVIKPAEGMGTVDTWAIAHIDELPEAVQETARAHALIAEEFVTGDEYHVDAVWTGGEPSDFGVSLYVVPRIEIRTPGRNNGSLHLREEDFPEIYEELISLGRDVNSALGITDGITHAEFFRTREGQWVFSEIATRPAGGAICNVFSAFGDDLRVRWMKTELGCADDISRSHPDRPIIGWVNLAPETRGVIARTPDPAALARHPFVRQVIPGHQIGDVVGTLHPSVWSWMAVIEADDEAQFIERMRILEIEAAFDIIPESEFTS
ncbi:ATP-grasp domain-containing protein [Microbacterium sp. SSW1-49]|uniref:ATP-grasp domain-containing protein n=1 Tax=Microbacterium croceum TaxID=2851645 RepID=A0ABT0FH25_9MICO|nr:ATP-grasp domain-containing protein [Microbacterium croceum]MCK2037022.1 ATP-grasp domain-containing protein [Microbacterium croceum]